MLGLRPRFAICRPKKDSHRYMTFFASTILYPIQVAISNWSTTSTKSPEKRLSSDYIDGSKISLAARFFRQITLLASSVLFFLFESYDLNYHFTGGLKTIWFSWHILVEFFRGPPRGLQFHRRPHLVEVFCV